MLKIHKDATPIILKTKVGDVQIGWQVITQKFIFDAVKNIEDDSINVYVDWGKDQCGDMTSHEDWSEVQRWLDTLIQTSGK